MNDGQDLDIVANRAARKWSRKELAARLLWGLAHPLFTWSPRSLWGWRRFLLRLFGAGIGSHVHIYPTVRIAIPWNVEIGDFAAVGDRAILYALGTISIGNRATISQGAHLCAGTHDFRDLRMPLLKQPITIGEGVWVAAEAFIGPNVTIGRHAVIGARAVVVRDVPEGIVVAGNPARKVASRW